MAPEPHSKEKSKSHKDRSERKHKLKTKDGKKRKHEHDDDAEDRKSKKHRKSHATTANGSITIGASISLQSPFHTQTSSLYLPLAPISQRQPLEGICAEHLSPLILTYYPPLRGVVLSYSNARLSERPFNSDGEETLMQCIDEYGVSYAWVTADFLIFKPQRGGELEGYVNLQNEGHLGVVCWNLFNASIERQRLPKSWQWVGVETAAVEDGNENYNESGAGHFVDENGGKIAGTVKFKVKDIESSADHERGFLSIEGTMLEEEEEQELLRQEMSKNKKHILGSGTSLGGAKALGATNLGVPAERSQDDFDNQSKRHRVNY